MLSMLDFDLEVFLLGEHVVPNLPLCVVRCEFKFEIIHNHRNQLVHFDQRDLEYGQQSCP